jgi:hypothetical protein
MPVSVKPSDLRGSILFATPMGWDVMQDRIESLGDVKVSLERKRDHSGED